MLNLGEKLLLNLESLHRDKVSKSGRYKEFVATQTEHNEFLEAVGPVDLYCAKLSMKVPLVYIL